MDRLLSPEKGQVEINEVIIAMDRTLFYIKDLPAEELSRSPMYIIHTLRSFYMYYQEIERYEKVLDCFDVVNHVLRVLNAETKYPQIALEAYDDMGYFFLDVKDYTMARRYFENFLFLSRNNSLENDPSTVRAHGNLSLIALHLNNRAELHTNLEKMEKGLIEVWKSDLSEKDKFEATLQSIDAYSNMSLYMFENQQFNQSLKYLTRSLEIGRSFIKQASPSSKDIIHDTYLLISKIQQNLSLQQVKLGHEKDTIRKFEELVTEMETLIGKTHLDLAPTLEHLSTLYFNSGRYLDSIELSTRVVEIFNKANFKGRRVINSLILLAKAFEKIEDRSAATTCYRRAMDMCNDIKDSATASNLFFEVGNAEFQSGRILEAIGYFRKSYALIDKKKQSHLYNELVVMLTNSLMNPTVKAYEEAELILSDTVQDMEKKNVKLTEDGITCYKQLAKLHSARGNTKEANNIFQKLFTQLKKHKEFLKTEIYADVLLEYAVYQYKSGNYSKAKENLDNAHKLVDEIIGTNTDSLKAAKILYWTGIYFLEQKQYDQAFYNFSKALSMRHALRETDSYEYGKLIMEYGKVLYLRKEYKPALEALLLSRKAIIRTNPVESTDSKSKELEFLDEMISKCEQNL